MKLRDTPSALKPAAPAQPITRNLQIVEPTAPSTAEKKPNLGGKLIQFVLNEGAKAIVENSRPTPEQVTTPTNLGVGTPLSVRFGLGRFKRSSPKTATPEEEKIPFDKAFDHNVREFESSVFVGKNNPLVFIEKEGSRVLRSGNDRKMIFLDTNYFCAEGKSGDAHAMYGRIGGLFGSDGTRDTHGTFDGGIRMERKNSLLLMYGPNGEIWTFRKASAFEGAFIEKRLRFHRLPKRSIPSYLADLPGPGGQRMFIDAPAYRYDEKKVRCFVGTPGKMRSVPIEKITTYRDGGTTYVDTAEGTLYSPSSFHPEREWTFQAKGAAEPVVIQGRKYFGVSEEEKEAIYQSLGISPGTERLQYPKTIAASMRDAQTTTENEASEEEPELKIAAVASA